MTKRQSCGRERKGLFMPKLTYKYDWKKIKENAISKHQKDTGMGSVKDAVQKVFSENKMGNPYEKYEEMRAKGISETRLHASRGRQLQQDNINVLEIDVAGSGFWHPRAKHIGFDGENNFEEGNNSASVQEINQNKKWKMHWWNRAKWLQRLPKWIRPRSKKEILEHNQFIDKYGEKINAQAENEGKKTQGSQRTRLDELFEQKYGKPATAEGLKGKKYIYVKESGSSMDAGIQTTAHRTRYSMPGPLGTVMGMMPGIRNRGDYNIESLSGYILAAGKDYLTKIFNEWDQMEKGPREADGGMAGAALDPEGALMNAGAGGARQDFQPVTVMLRGHSRGGVAVSHGAMRIKHWIHENYPQYENYVNFEMVQMDPVPGYGSDHGAKRNINLEEETRPEIQEEMAKRGMRSLGSSANTTVVYSLHTDYNHFFSPQIVDGAKRIILTAAEHSVNLDKVDESQKKYDNNKAHRQGYVDLESGEVYRNSGLSELPEGVYIADENNRLIKIPSLEVGRKIIGEVLGKTSGQEGRHERIDEVMDHWFKAHPMEKAKAHEAMRERTSVRELEASERTGNLNGRTYSDSGHQVSREASRQQEAGRNRGMSAGR